jgi:hypothetical protein
MKRDRRKGSGDHKTRGGKRGEIEMKDTGEKEGREQGKR